MQSNEVSYEEYLELVKDAVMLKTGAKVEVKPNIKNNGVVLDGLMIMSEEDNMSPVIWLNQYYKEFLMNGIEVVADKVIALYEEHKRNIPFDVTGLMDISKVKPLIRMGFINYKKNEQLLKEMVHRKELDLAIVFIILLETENDGLFGTIMVRKSLFDYWKISEEALYQIAQDNIKNVFVTTSLDAMFESIVGDEFDKESLPKSNLHLLTTQSEYYGAIGMLQTELLKAFMKRHHADKLIIIPCSVKEVLLYPYNKDDEVDKAELYATVREVNTDQVEAVEFLSNNVYMFDGESVEIF